MIAKITIEVLSPLQAPKRHAGGVPRSFFVNQNGILSLTGMRALRLTGL